MQIMGGSAGQGNLACCMYLRGSQRAGRDVATGQQQQQTREGSSFSASSLPQHWLSSLFVIIVILMDTK